MIRCEVIENFSLKDFDKLKNIERAGTGVYGKLKVHDKFDCDEEMAKYLTGENDLKKVVVKVIEIKPVEEDKTEQVKPTKKKSKKKESKKKKSE